MSKKFEYYPPGTSPDKYPLCDAPMGRNYRDEKVNCLLQPGHEGKHQAGVNWNAHVECGPSSHLGGCEVAFRSWHDSRALVVRSREEAQALLEFLCSSFDAVFGETQ